MAGRAGAVAGRLRFQTGGQEGAEEAGCKSMTGAADAMPQAGPKGPARQEVTAGRGKAGRGCQKEADIPFGRLVFSAPCVTVLLG